MPCSSKSNTALKETSEHVDDEFFEKTLELKEYREKLDSEGFYNIIDEMTGKKEKIGVFGSYLPEDRPTIKDLCVHIAEKGYIVLTGKGFFHPSAPDVYVEFTPFLPEQLQKIFQNLDYDDYYFQNILPSLISKAVCRVMPLRTQLLELKGCEKNANNKPVFGFDDCEPTESEKEKCNWVDITHRSSDRIMDCKVEHQKSCPVDKKRKVNCIFYQHKVPQGVKNLFLKNSWKYYSVSNYRQLYPYIDSFLQK